MASNAREDNNSSVTDKQICKINGPPMPEKEAFLAYHVDADEEEEEDSES